MITLSIKLRTNNMARRPRASTGCRRRIREVCASLETNSRPGGRVRRSGELVVTGVAVHLQDAFEPAEQSLSLAGEY